MGLRRADGCDEILLLFTDTGRLFVNKTATKQNVRNSYGARPVKQVQIPCPQSVARTHVVAADLAPRKTNPGEGKNIFSPHPSKRKSLLKTSADSLTI